MIHAAIEVPLARRSSEMLIGEALRCWSRARALKTDVIPKIYGLLAISGRPMLAPALASMLALFEDWLGRPPASAGPRQSADEALLLTLLEEAAGTATPFESALCSTRAMLWEGL